MGSSSKNTRARRDITRLICSFSPHALAHFAKRAIGGQVEEIHHRGGFFGVKVRKETAVDADGLLGVPGGVEEVRVGQV